jgi:hypothetical protein
MADAIYPALHGRQHCPGGEDPIPCFPVPAWFRGVCDVNVVRTSGGSQTTVDWPEWDCSDIEVFTPLDASLATADPGETVRRVQLNAAGWYSIYFGALPTATASGPIELAMHDGDDTWGFPDQVIHSSHTSFADGFLTFQLNRIYPIFDPFGGTNDTPQISFTVAQVTGASVTFNPLWMEIHYLPADTAAVAS